ncbi:MAG TPA: BON domain-containing protein [Steroidobacteraceae bacterium]|nr:BON domain-containing protein [Steroidobacteraceae bacterium]
MRRALLAVVASFFLGVACTSMPAPSPAQARTDADIAARVYAAIKASPTWFYPALEVQVRNGRVYLTGLTFDPPAYDAATDIARHVPGVATVTNAIVVDAGR